MTALNVLRETTWPTPAGGLGIDKKTFVFDPGRTPVTPFEHFAASHPGVRYVEVVRDNGTNIRWFIDDDEEAPE